MQKKGGLKSLTTQKSLLLNIMELDTRVNYICVHIRYTYWTFTSRISSQKNNCCSLRNHFRADLQMYDV